MRCFLGSSGCWHSPSSSACEEHLPLLFSTSEKRKTRRRRRREKVSTKRETPVHEGKTLALTSARERDRETKEKEKWIHAFISLARRREERRKKSTGRLERWRFLLFFLSSMTKRKEKIYRERERRSVLSVLQDNRD